MNDLMAPITGGNPAGENMNYSPVFDQIREARRQDDPSLAMGEWEVVLKVSDWPRVARLCEETLRYQTKDLQLLVWYAEALVRIRGFDGAGSGLLAIAAWLRDFWETGFPEYEPHDLDERIGKLEWLNQHLSLALKQVPLVSPAHGGFHWLDWYQSREVDNLGLRNPEARQAALASGKLSGEQFDKVAQESGGQWFLGLSAELDRLHQAYGQLDALMLQRFGEQAPALVELREVILACQDLVTRYLQRTQGAVPVVDAASAPAGRDASAIVSQGHNRPTVTTMPHPTVVLTDGQIQNRQQAVLMLREVALYFRHNEPHSPVALLAERAARWADMSLEQWLQHVVKDDSTLQQLRELLDVREG